MNLKGIFQASTKLFNEVNQKLNLEEAYSYIANRYLDHTNIEEFSKKYDPFFISQNKREFLSSFSFQKISFFFFLKYLLEFTKNDFFHV